MTTTSRYCVGIDLGTTNSVLAFIDTLIAEVDEESSRILPIEQKVGPTSEQGLPYLPSALLYEPHADPQWTVGRYAADQARYQPQRVVVSAKSWLSHSAVNRESKILPWGSTEVPSLDQISPVEASSRMLSSIRDAWNRHMAGDQAEYRLEEQDVVITVPASFDEVAQALTLRAVHDIGLKHVRLLEEPQSAFYRWLESSGHQLRSGQLVLVCDVGGGTTDLSLFEVSSGSGRLPLISRLDVSEHVLLGGDNIDAALAEHLGALLREKQGNDLSFSQRLSLRAIARDLKERVLSDSSKGEETVTVSVPGGGSSLLASSISLEISTHELRKKILDGFFPLCLAEEMPVSSRGGLREAGLPYARDPRITAHISGFLRGRSIGAVLFNGGTLRDSSLRERIIECLRSWQSQPLEELHNCDLDAAVARGAAWYAFMQRQRADRLIFAGYPRSLYVELYRQSRTEAPKLLCIVPKGFTGDQALVVDSPGLSALVDRPVRFQVWSSLARGGDAPGVVISESDGEVQPLASVATKLSLPAGHSLAGGARLPISIVTTLSETGLLALECRGTVPGTQGITHDVSWKLTFNVRKEEEGDSFEAAGEAPSSATVQRCVEVIDRFYGRRKATESDERPKGLFKSLEEASRMKREEWSISLMRAMWPACERGLTRRSRSLDHEVSWLNLAGFILRPGFGAPMDGIRVDEAWRVQETGLAYPKETAARAAACIFWRRIAAGLSTSRQEILFRQYFPEMSKSPAHGAELLRMIASLERIDVSSKERLFEALFQLASSARSHAFGSGLGWALERLFARVPLCGELDVVVPASVAEGWTQRILEGKNLKISSQELHAILLSVGAKTGDSRRDVSPELKDVIVKRLRSTGAPSASIDGLQHVIELEHRQISRLLGENMPAGLVLA